MQPIADPPLYITDITSKQIQDQLHLLGAVRAMLYSYRAQRELKMHFHLGASQGIQEDAEALWKTLGEVAFANAAWRMKLNVKNAETDFMEWGRLTAAEKRTSDQLRLDRSPLQQRDFENLLPILVTERREKLAPAANIDAMASSALYSGKGPSIRPADIRAAREQEEAVLLELLQRMVEMQAAYAKDLAALATDVAAIRQQLDKLAILDDLLELAHYMQRLLELLERRPEMSEADFHS